MVSRENRVLLVSTLVVLPVSVLVGTLVHEWYALPGWVGGVGVLAVAVLLPQFYLGYLDAAARSA